MTTFDRYLLRRGTAAQAYGARELMLLEPLIILAALCCGLLARMAGMPALIGYLAAGFFLPRWIGMTNSYWLAIAITTIAGLAALLFARSKGTAPTQEKSSPSRSNGKLSLPWPLTGLAFFSGFTTLALEVLWTRMFAQTLHNSVYTYATILVTFLVALAVLWISFSSCSDWPSS